MAARGSALSRAIRFMEEGDVHEVEFVLQRGAEILAGRSGAKPVRKPKKAKARRSNAAESHEAQSTEAN